MMNSLKKWAAWFGAGANMDTLSAPAVGEGIAVRNTVSLVKSSDPQVVALLGGAMSEAGFAVTPDTAMRVSAVYACVRLLAGAIASIPVSIYRTTDAGREEFNPELWWLLNEQPCQSWTAASMWAWVIQSISLRGDGFVEIVRKGAGVGSLRPLHPDRVDVRRSGDFLLYSYSDETGGIRAIHQDDMLHFPGFGFNGLRSMSALQWAAFKSVGIALAADTFSGAFFANGAAPKHVIMAANRMDPEQIENLRAEYKRKNAGASAAGLPMVLTEGLTVKEMSMTAGDAQLLESRKFQVIDIARAFGVPPHMIGAQEANSSWGSGIEQMSIGFIRYSLQMHLDQIRQELNRKLFRRASPFVVHKMEALLAGDSTAKAAYYRQALGGSQGPGWMTTDEVRAMENLPKIDGGNVLFTPTKDQMAKPDTKTDTKGSNEKASPTDTK